jgi:hypothetical protein
MKLATKPFFSFNKVEIITDLYDVFSKTQMSLVDVTWMQHQFHEKRRWSAVDFLKQVNFDSLSKIDMVCIWNAGRAELTTKPGADRLARLTDAECRRWLDTDSSLAAVMQACGTWSRYWNEEESYHETTFNAIAGRLGLEPISNDTFIEFRKIFPDDNALRTLFLLVISEIIATVNYLRCAAITHDPGLRAIFKQIAADEAQHMRYFISFSKALIDSGKYHSKDAFSIAHLFLRDDGEIQGSDRKRIENRETHVNWWDHIETGDIERPDDIEGKQKMIFSALEKVTGICVASPVEVEETWMELVA